MKSETPSLQELLASTARGDHSAFEQVYQRTHAHLFGLAFRMLKREQAAEDVLQEAFVSIWKNAASYRSNVGGQELQPMTWLIAIVRNKALDTLRSPSWRKEVELGDPGEPQHDDSPHAEHGASPLELFAQAGRALQIQDCLGSLDGTHRQSIALAFYQGLSHGEIASRMGAPLGSVKAWIRRGLEKLKGCLLGQGVRA